ncbi:MAG: hypothetical protein ACM3YF_02255 [Candidatus Zixiibacteriota bacterium]
MTKTGRKISGLVVFLLSVFALSPFLQANTLIPKLAVWKYYADAAYPSGTWSQPGFDDSGWPSGAGTLG